MSNLSDIYEPGDRVYTENHAGQVFVYIVRPDGALVLIQEPST